MAYREQSAPATSTRVWMFRPLRFRRVLLGFCLWFMGFWFIAPGVQWLVEPIVDNEALWKIPISLIPIVLVPVGIARICQVETLVVTARELRRFGFFRTARIAWSQVAGREPVTRRVTRKGGGTTTVHLTNVLGHDGQSLMIAPLQVEDDQGIVHWAIDKAAADQAMAIDERLRREGAPARRVWFWAWPHALTGVVMVGALSWFVYGVEKAHVDEGAVHALHDLPRVERLAGARAMAEDTHVADRIRCRARSLLIHDAAAHGETEAAVAHCHQMEQLSCFAFPYAQPSGCSAVEALHQAHGLVEAGESGRALDALERCYRANVAFRDHLRIRALEAEGRLNEIPEVAEHCVELFGESDDAIVQQWVATCRPHYVPTP